MTPSKLQLIMSISTLTAALGILVLSANDMFEISQTLVYVLVLSCVFISKILETSQL